MSQSSPHVSYRKIAAALTPTAVSQYLAASQPWELDDRVDQIKEIWSLPGDDGAPKARIMLPLATDYADFEQRFSDALYAIGLINDWDADEVQLHVAATRADLLFIRLDQASADNTIPIRQAEITIDAIYKMLKAAATTAAAPRHSHQGRPPGAVSSFLDQDVRLGHTKRGSFVFTVVTRLEDITPDLSQPTLPSPELETLFPRQVMETLARGLETTRDLTQGRATAALTDPAQWGLSASLVESLEDIAQPEGLRSLGLSFEWAATGRKPTVGAEPITLEHSVVPELARVREHLVRQEEPPRRETLAGVVRSLAREDGLTEADEMGSVMIAAEVNGRSRNVHMTLSGQDHDWAIQAYRTKLPLIVTGDLVFERRAWRLVGDIEVDASFLRSRTMFDGPHETA